MKFSNYNQSENKISFKAYSKIVNLVCKLKSKSIIRKIRKLYNIPKSTPITYSATLNYEFNIGE